MSWVVLFCAALFEIVWALGLKSTEGFTRFWPSAMTIGAMVASFFLLSQALKTIPVGTAYAVWTGIGAVGTAILGMVLLGEPRDVGCIVSLVIIGIGIIGLKFFSAH